MAVQLKEGPRHAICEFLCQKTRQCLSMCKSVFTYPYVFKKREPCNKPSV